jgi:nucleoside-diphosphate-sugar epimerase
MELSSVAFGMVRAVQLPGITAGVGEMADALARIAGEKVAARIRWRPDPLIQKIVAGWPARVAASRARAMGFEADASIDEIIQAHIEDELGGGWVP